MKRQSDDVHKKPILYYLMLSPPARACLLTAKAIGLELELKEMNLFAGEHLTPEFIKINPQHTVPLLDDNGTYIIDSHVICGYLCDKYGTNDKWYPKDLIKRANVNARLHFDSSFIFSRLRFFYETTIVNGSDSTEILQFLQKIWPIMEEYLKDTPYVCGNEMTIADFCCIATISSIDEIAPIDETKYPKLIGWMKRMAELPYYQRCNGEGAAALKKFYADKLNENLLNK